MILIVSHESECIHTINHYPKSLKLVMLSNLIFKTFACCFPIHGVNHALIWMKLQRLRIVALFRPIILQLISKPLQKPKNTILA